jgi:hypothetical protein
VGHVFAHVAASVAVGATWFSAGVAYAAEFPRLCDVVFVESTGAAVLGLGHLAFRLHYTPGKLAFGSDPAACSVAPSQVGTTGTFAADDAAGTLDVGLSRKNGLLLEPLVVCGPRGSADVETTALTVDVLEAQNLDGRVLVPTPVVDVDTFECSSSPPPTTTTLPVTTTLGSLTTTTVASGTTTSTIPAPPLCGDGDGNGTITAADALLALRKAVGAASCPVERCDTDASGSVTATDALRVLRAAIGISELLTCS